MFEINKILIYGLLILLLLIIIFISNIIISNIILSNIILYSKNTNKEKFITVNNDPDNDGKMTFDYLNNPNYTNNILSRYYIDDDKKINGIRIIQHPYQKSNTIQIQGSPRKYYGNLYQEPLYSDYLYKTYGIRL